MRVVERMKAIDGPTKLRRERDRATLRRSRSASPLRRDDATAETPRGIASLSILEATVVRRTMREDAAEHEADQRSDQCREIRFACHSDPAFLCLQKHHRLNTGGIRSVLNTAISPS